MKNMVRAICVVGMLVAATLLVTGCGEEEVSTTPVPTTPAEKTVVEAEILQKTCPVMGLPIDKNIYVDYEGRRVYFCCQMCVDTFNKDPQKYLAIVDAELKSGGAEAAHEGHEGHGTQEGHEGS